MPIPELTRKTDSYQPIDLQAYLDEKLFPAVYASLDAVFPEFAFKRNSRKWEATLWPSDFPLSVNNQDPSRLNVYQATPFFLAVHGHGGIPILQYVNSGRPVKGPDFMDAVTKLSERVRLTPPIRAVTEEELEKLRARASRRNALEAVYEIAHEYMKTSKSGQWARDYVESRGFTQERWYALQFGLMPPVAELKASLREKGGEALVKEAEAVGATWPAISGYISIPWRDETGAPLTIYGRWPGKNFPLMKDKPGFEKRREALLASKPGEEPIIPKTMALPGENTKASPLYFDRARRAGHRDILVAVEGVLDAAMLQIAGDERVVAYVAAQFSSEQVQTLVRYRVRSVVIVPDPDGGGEKGAQSSVKALENAGIKSFVASLPEGMDPDEFVVEYGIEAWYDLVDQKAITGAKYLAGLVLKDVTPADSDMKRRTALEAVFELAESLNGPHAALDRQEVLELAGERTGFVEEALAEYLEQRLWERERKQTQEGLERAARDALKAIKEGGSPFVIGDNLRNALNALKPREADIPAAFSVARLEKETRGLTGGLSTGWGALDEVDVRLHGGELAVLAARTGHGKTTALVNLLDNLVDGPEEGLTVFFTLEEPEVRIFHRLISLKTAKDHGEAWSANQVRDYLMDKELAYLPDEKALNNALEALRERENRLVVVYRPAWTVAHMAAYVKELARREPIKAVLADYLQRISPGAGNESRRRDEEVSSIARGLRDLAVEVACPVIVGAQINREAAKRGQDALGGSWGDKEVQAALKKKRPQLHELREGGSEQEAELVLGLHNWRADFQDETGADQIPDTTRLEVGVLKNRYGTVGRWAALAFTGAYGLIRDARTGEV